MKGHLLKHDHRRSFGECFFNLWKGQIDPLRSNVPRDDITLVRFGGPQGLPFEPLEPPSKLMRGMIVFPSVSEPDVSVLAQLLEELLYLRMLFCLPVFTHSLGCLRPDSPVSSSGAVGRRVGVLCQDCIATRSVAAEQ